MTVLLFEGSGSIFDPIKALVHTCEKDAEVHPLPGCFYYVKIIKNIVSRVLRHKTMIGLLGDLPNVGFSDISKFSHVVSQITHSSQD